MNKRYNNREWNPHGHYNERLPPRTFPEAEPFFPPQYYYPPRDNRDKGYFRTLYNGHRLYPPKAPVALDKSYEWMSPEVGGNSSGLPPRLLTRQPNTEPGMPICDKDFKRNKSMERILAMHLNLMQQQDREIEIQTQEMKKLRIKVSKLRHHVKILRFKVRQNVNNNKLPANKELKMKLKLNILQRHFTMRSKCNELKLKQTIKQLEEEMAKFKKKAAEDLEKCKNEIVELEIKKAAVEELQLKKEEALERLKSLQQARCARMLCQGTQTEGSIEPPKTITDLEKYPEKKHYGPIKTHLIHYQQQREEIPDSGTGSEKKHNAPIKTHLIHYQQQCEEIPLLTYQNNNQQQLQDPRNDSTNYNASSSVTISSTTTSFSTTASKGSGDFNGKKLCSVLLQRVNQETFENQETSQKLDMPTSPISSASSSFDKSAISELNENDEVHRHQDQVEIKIIDGEEIYNESIESVIEEVDSMDGETDANASLDSSIINNSNSTCEPIVISPSEMNAEDTQEMQVSDVVMECDETNHIEYDEISETVCLAPSTSTVSSSIPSKQQVSIMVLRATDDGLQLFPMVTTEGIIEEDESHSKNLLTPAAHLIPNTHQSLEEQQRQQQHQLQQQLQQEGQTLNQQGAQEIARIVAEAANEGQPANIENNSNDSSTTIVIEEEHAIYMEDESIQDEAPNHIHTETVETEIVGSPGFHIIDDQCVEQEVELQTVKEKTEIITEDMPKEVQPQERSNIVENFEPSLEDKEKQQLQHSNQLTDKPITENSELKHKLFNSTHNQIFESISSNQQEDKDKDKDKAHVKDLERQPFQNCYINNIIVECKEPQQLEDKNSLQKKSVQQTQQLPPISSTTQIEPQLNNAKPLQLVQPVQPMPHQPLLLTPKQKHKLQQQQLNASITSEKQSEEKPLQVQKQTQTQETAAMLLASKKGSLNNVISRMQQHLTKQPPTTILSLMPIESQQTKQKLEDFLQKEQQKSAAIRKPKTHIIKSFNSNLIFPPIHPNTMTPDPTPTSTPNSTPTSSASATTPPASIIVDEKSPKELTKPIYKKSDKNKKKENHKIEMKKDDTEMKIEKVTKPLKTECEPKPKPEPKLVLEPEPTPEPDSETETESETELEPEEEIIVLPKKPHVPPVTSPAFLITNRLYASRDWEHIDFHFDNEFFLEEAAELYKDRPKIVIPKYKRISNKDVAVTDVADNTNPAEDITDERYARRHNPLVKEEIKRKAQDWKDMQIECRRLQDQQKELQNLQIDLTPPPSTLYPLPSENMKILFTSEVPVQAFGECIVRSSANTADFQLPWQSQEKSETTTIETLDSIKNTMTAAQVEHQKLWSQFKAARKRKRKTLKSQENGAAAAFSGAPAKKRLTNSRGRGGKLTNRTKKPVTNQLDELPKIKGTYTIKLDQLETAPLEAPDLLSKS